MSCHLVLLVLKQKRWWMSSSFYEMTFCKIDCINQISSVVVTRKMQEKTKNIYVNSPWHLHQQTKCFNFTDFHYNTNAHFRENAELQQAINVEMAQVYEYYRLFLKPLFAARSRYIWGDAGWWVQAGHYKLTVHITNHKNVRIPWIMASRQPGLGSSKYLISLFLSGDQEYRLECWCKM